MCTMYIIMHVKIEHTYRDFDPILEQLKKIVKNPNVIGISSNLKHSIRACICISKKYKNGEFSTFHFWQNLAKIPVL